MTAPPVASSVGEPDWTSWADSRPELPRAAAAMLAREVGSLTARTTAPIEDARVPASRLGAPARAAFVAALGAANVLDDDASRARHAGGQAYADLVRRRGGDAAHAPDAVLTPGDAEEVAAILTIAVEHGVAVVPWGGGTSVVGGLDRATGPHSALVACDLHRLNRLVAVDAISQTAAFGPGITTPDAERALAAHGLTLGHVPQSFERATLGGYAVTRSAGQASSGIGRFDDLVVGLRMATPAGELVVPVRSGSAAGPDLGRLVLGSEGTLGVVTEVTVRVRALPGTTAYDGWVARTWDEGLAALRSLAQGDGPAPDILRLSDPEETRISLALGGSSRRTRTALSAYLRARHATGGCLVIVGYEGSERSVRSRRREVSRSLRDAGLIRLGAKAGASWVAHRFAGPRLRDTLLDTGVLAETLETATTWSALPGLYDAVRASLRTSLPGSIVGVHVSHVYPVGASLYVTVLAAATPGAEISQWQQAKNAVNSAIVSAGGTITHHHAVGTAHRDAASTDLGGPVGLQILRAVKASLDPTGVLNPGKLLPDS